MSPKRNNGRIVIGVMLGALLVATSEAWSISITFVDPPGGHPPPPPPVHPAKPWTGPEKKVVEEAVSEWNLVIRNHGANWTLRWEDARLFKNWGAASCDFSMLAGVTGIAAEFLRCGIPAGQFPVNEIYFNLGVPWFVDDTPAFDGDDRKEVPRGQIDLLTLAKHELGHAVIGPGHLPRGVNGLMRETHFGPQERLRITRTDLDFARQQGIDVIAAPPGGSVPEPGATALVCLGLAGLWRRISVMRRR